MEETQTYRILWQRRKDGGARLLRMYGTSPQVLIPSEIAGHPCVEIAPYCFAPNMRLPEEGCREEILSPEDGSHPYLQELCKNAVEEVILPDTVEEIGGCAFYDCRKLKRLHMGAAVRTIGSDAFMNAFKRETKRKLCCFIPNIMNPMTKSPRRICLAEALREKGFGPDSVLQTAEWILQVMTGFFCRLVWRNLRILFSKWR